MKLINNKEKMSEKVCRTCLKVIQNDSEAFSIENSQTSDKISLKQKLQACVPEVVLHRVKNSILCHTCVGLLNSAYKFKTRCLETESDISKYLTKRRAKYLNLSTFLTDRSVTNNSNDDDDVVVIDSPSSNNLSTPNSSVPNNSIKCLICKKAFKTLEEFQEHAHTHGDNDLDSTRSTSNSTSEQFKTHNEATLQCSHCDFTTKDKNDYIVHNSEHTGDKYYSCELCPFKSNRAYSVRRHLKRHAGEKVYQCTLCPFKAVDDAALRTHTKTHSVQSSFNCKECSYVTTKRSYLKKHVRRSHSNKGKGSKTVKAATNPFQISMTDVKSILEGKNVEEITNKVNSENNIDENLDSFIITVADIKGIIKNGCNDENLEKKLSRKNNNKKKNFRCPKCRLQFKFQYLLRKHMPSHSGDNKPHRCNHCGFTDTRKSTFEVHMKLHTGGKVFSCDKCEFRTVYMSSMQKHNRVHTGQQPFKCSYCNYKTLKMPNFEKHLQKHTVEETILKCAECSFETTNADDMEQHRQMHVIGNEFIDNSIHDFLPRIF